jgi:Ala-tRNA(Pro) deacylase
MEGRSHRDAPGTTLGVARVTHWLEERGVDFELVTHPETFTAVDEAQAAGVPAGHVAKTLALREQDSYRLVVIPASRRLDLSRVRGLGGRSPHLRLASEHEIARDFPHFKVGALPPFGPLLPAPEIVDIRLLYHDRILCGAGDHRHAVSLDPRELLRIAEPQVADICERIPGSHDASFGELPHL